MVGWAAPEPDGVAAGLVLGEEDFLFFLSLADFLAEALEGEGDGFAAGFILRTDLLARRYIGRRHWYTN